MSYEDLKKHVLGQQQSDVLDQDSIIINLVESLADDFANEHHNIEIKSRRDEILSKIESLSDEDLSRAIDYCMLAIRKVQQDRHQLLNEDDNESRKTVTNEVSTNLTMFYEKTLEILKGFKKQDKETSLDNDGK
ncbi:MAG: hypothetical protein E7356_01370 [Clostridiales bacterium]|nr:hypothetical protein [Clostridiales bacterium]